MDPALPDKAHHRAWDRDYHYRGNLFGGVAPQLPPLEPGSRILELGCGNGKTLSAMIRMDWDIVAIDISPKAVKLCEKLVELEIDRCLSRVRFLVADATDLPFEDGSFDAIFAYHIFAHGPVEEREEAAREASRVLKPGGQLFFRDFSRADMRFGKGKKMEEATFMRGSGTLTHYFTKSEVKELFSMLEPEDIKIDNWEVVIRGTRHTRAVVDASFVKGLILLGDGAYMKEGHAPEGEK